MQTQEKVNEKRKNEWDDILRDDFPKEEEKAEI